MTDALQPASVPAIDFRQLAEEVRRQPELFSVLEADVREMDVVRAARERRYTGARTDEARAAQIVALRATGASLSAIERRLGADHRTVRAVVRAAEDQGIVPGIKEVVARRMSELAEKTMDVVDRELDSPEPDAQLIKAGWVGIGIAADKLVAAPTPPPTLHLHAHVGGGAQDPAEVYAAMLRSADAESAGHPAKAFGSSGSAARDTVLDVSDVTPEAGGAGAADLAGSADASLGAVQNGGAGGVEARPARPGGDGTP